MTDLILASGSAVRATLLKNAGLSFDVDPAKVDERALEEPMLESGASPTQIAVELARAKSCEVSSRRPGALVIGADQILDFEGKRLTKPADLDAARAQLAAFSGKSHSLHSAVCISRDGEVVWEDLSTATLSVRHLSDAFLDDYIARAGEPILSSVGAYQLESLGVQLFNRIDGDYFTVLGLPLLPVLNFLREQGSLLK
ncbi:Maf family protein [Pseudovibrio sp. SPO723]|uniref:Maf family protein n=1 Tax=Nesiotobacter zosterae TaxID=392721 RepID=UPI0029C444A7|nr:Maf family protein [Pseudovibrio sp. SPO723]MDX5595118.1 Maf family protein [Pseudovibrio sp. SPO723]